MDGNIDIFTSGGGREEKGGRGGRGENEVEGQDQFDIRGSK